MNTLVIGWGGWGDVDLDGSIDYHHIPAHIEPTIHQLLDHILENNLPLKFTLLLAHFPRFETGVSAEQLTDDQREMVTNYMWDTYFGPTAKYRSIALKMDGQRPTVFASSWADDGRPDAWFGRHGFTDDRFELIEVAENHWHEEEFTSVYVYETPPSAIPGRDGIVFIWPRHSNLFPFLTGNPNFPWLNEDTLIHIDPEGEEGLYDAAWQEIIDHPDRSEISMVWIWSWNNYDDLTSIEPDSGVGAYALGDLLLRKTAHYYNLFRSGLPFKEYVQEWVSLEEFRPTIGNVAPQDLGLASEYEKDALLRRILRQAQDWIARYTGRTFSGPTHNVVGWVDPFSTMTRLNVAAYRDVLPGTVVRIGSEDGRLPVEFAQVKNVVEGRNTDVWEMAYPLKHDRDAGDMIVEVTTDSNDTSEVPPSAKEATIRLAGNIWHYIVHTPKGRLMNIENIGVSQIDDSVFTDGIKRDLDLWKKRGRAKR